MLKLKELDLGFTDATNYSKRHNKPLFNKFFVQSSLLGKLLEPDRYFLIGEKGTGKTAFAVFLSNNNYKEHRSSVTAINETDYQAFIHLKRQRNLELSGYDNVWRTILLLLLSKAITAEELDNHIIERSARLNAIQRAIDNYHNNAFSPEIVTALNMVKQSARTARFMAQVASAELGEKTKLSFQQHTYQTNLQYITRQLHDALGRLKLRQSRILFIDGIDIRPHGVDYPEYLECVQGLANAAWYLNNTLFTSFRDSPGRLRVVLLLRPDIFAALGLQNQNAKIQDNAVYLDWLTTYPYYRSSDIFEVGDRLLAVQQEHSLAHGTAWDYYFPFKNNADDSFVSFLRYSFFRPRDIIAMMILLRDRAIATRGKDVTNIEAADFENPEFRRDLSNYLLGEVKDQLQFYFSVGDYELFRAFFAFLGGKARFTFQEFVDAFRSFQRSRVREKTPLPEFMEEAAVFLQFLFELGVICYKEYQQHKAIYRWCFRERGYANMSPQIGNGADDYEIHYGLQKALNAGSRIQR